MTQAGGERAKRADPNCVVGGVGVSGVDCGRNPRFPFAREVWAKVHDTLDGSFFGAYANNRYFAPGLRCLGPEENDEEGMLQEAVALVKGYGPDKRVAIEEKGWAVDGSLWIVPMPNPWPRCWPDPTSWPGPCPRWTTICGSRCSRR